MESWRNLKFCLKIQKRQNRFQNSKIDSKIVKIVVQIAILIKFLHFFFKKITRSFLTKAMESYRPTLVGEIQNQNFDYDWKFLNSKFDFKIVVQIAKIVKIVFKLHFAHFFQKSTRCLFSWNMGLAHMGKMKISLVGENNYFKSKFRLKF